MNTLQRTRMRFDDKIHARKAFSRFFLGYTVLYISALLLLYATVFVLSMILPYLPKNVATTIVAVFNSAPFRVFYQYFLLYPVGIPIMYMFIKNTKKWNIRPSGLGFGTFVVLFFVSCPFTLIGSLAGSTLNDIINSLLGLEDAGLFSDVPFWVMTVIALVVAPLFEELIFRKLLMDRIGVYGAWLSVIVSGLAFGAFHGTVEQLFYTTFGGIIFAIAYAKTGRIRYSILLHMVFNVFGAIIPTLVTEYLLTSTDFYYLIGVLILFTIKIGFSVVGIILFIIGLSCGWFRIQNPVGTVKITSNRARITFFNLGCILFTLLTAYLILISFMPLTEWIELIFGKYPTSLIFW